MTSLIPPDRRGFQAFGLAAVVEVCILSAAAAVVAWSAPPPPPPAPIPIQLTQLDPEPPKPEPPKLRPKLHEPAPKPLPAPRPVPQPPQPVPRPVAPTPFSEPLPPPPPPPPPPAPSTVGKPDPALSYAGRVHAAVQAAVVFPPAAAAMNYTGRTRVEFHLRDGVPTLIHVVQGSSLGMIDRAALKAVQDASYPPPPPPLQGIDLDYQIWVEFKRN